MHAIFNLHCKFLSAETIRILTVIISIPLAWEYFLYPHCMMCIPAGMICIIIIIIIIIIKKDWQGKAGRERLTPYQSKDPSPTLPTYRGKEEKGKIVEDKKGESN